MIINTIFFKENNNLQSIWDMVFHPHSQQQLKLLKIQELFGDADGCFVSRSKFIKILYATDGVKMDTFYAKQVKIIVFRRNALGHANIQRPNDIVL